MNHLYASRMSNSHKSFIREILKVTQDSNIISFAGGLPNPEFFPLEDIRKASSEILKEDGKEILQYTTTEGFYPLRKLIAERYGKRGLKADPDEILITNGSQQGLDLIAKVFLNPMDTVVIEKPGYLGAIQLFNLYGPCFKPVELEEDGLNTDMLEKILKKSEVKLLYTIPDFQNPSGVTYSKQKREEISSVVSRYNIISVEDNAYGELRFMGEDLPYMKSYLGDQGIILGSFSKIISPGLRLGWIFAAKEIIEKLVIAKQASDLHSNYLSQRIIHRYLSDCDIDEHIQTIKEGYKRQRDIMVSAIKEHFPDEVKYIQPEGGMFLWVMLPDHISSLELFDIALKENVAFVPGSAFYVDGSGSNSLRLNFSNSSEDKINEGIQRLSKAIKLLLFR